MLLKFQAVERFTRNPDNLDHHENDVEHSYHLAMAAWMLAPHFVLDANKAIRIALAHDLVEIYAGDTFAFGSQVALSDKDAREHAALEQLKNEWADFDDMLTCIEDYKSKGSEEAKFVYALDKVMPIIMNILSKGVVWQQHGVTMQKFIAEKERKIPKSSPVYQYYQELLEMLQETPEYFSAD